MGISLNEGPIDMWVCVPVGDWPVQLVACGVTVGLSRAATTSKHDVRPQELEGVAATCWLCYNVNGSSKFTNLQG